MSGVPRWAVPLTRPLELVNAAARALYASGLLEVRRAGVPVVSVGNIVLGGSGKTPLVAALVETLAAAGARPAIVSRGYGRRERRPALATAAASWEQVGDEPALLARLLPGVPVVVDADRARGAATAVGLGATHLVLDDAFQHWRLARDLDVVALDAADPLARRAARREHPRALARARSIVLMGEEPRDADLASLTRLAPRARFFICRVAPRAVRLGETAHRPDWLAGRRVHAAAGIAAPQRFFAGLRSLGCELRRAVEFPDHHPWRSDELQEILATARGDGALVVTTGKDAVKLPRALATEVAWLDIRLEGDFRAILAGLESPP
jgi:tetraacyldisaccharide 4'-kinase